MDPRLNAIPEVHRLFPNLQASNARKTSDRNDRYNCIAWAAEDPRRWWEPGVGKAGFWPAGVPGRKTLDAYAQAFEKRGYQRCDNGTFEAGYLKVAIYVDASGMPTHAARQLENQRWTSKLGKAEDIEHDLVDLEGPAYGKVALFLRRKSQSTVTPNSGAAPVSAK